MNKKLQFAIETAEVIDQDPLSQFATARIIAFSTGKSKHDTTCDAETLRKTAHTIYEKPIVFEHGLFGDFGTHSEHPIISGFVVKDSAKFIDQDDGRVSLEVTAKIWKRYAPQFIDIFKDSDTNKRSVSVEIEITSAEEDENGLVKLLDWVYSAVCVLGRLVTPASPGAEIEMVTFAEKENNDYKKAFEKEFASRYDDIDFTIPKNVKTNAKNGLDLHKEYGRGGTSVGLASARYIIKNDTASPEKVRHIAKYFPRHAKDNLDDKTSNGWIAWQLWGGSAGRKWSTSLVKQMDDADSKQMSYFAKEEEDMPYKSMDDVSPAIKGITPPVSLSQANEIARNAEKIGTTEEKNGWAISISNFKKTYTVKDGKWVKKKTANEKFALTSSQIYEILNASINETYGENNYRKYWVESYDDECVYIRDNEDDKIYCCSYTLDKENKTAAIDMSSKHEVIHGGYEPVGQKEVIGQMAEEDKVKEEEMAAEEPETPEEEKKESPEKEEQEKKEGTEKFSLDAYVDVAATLAFLEEETDDASEMAQKVKMAAEEIKKGDEADYGVVMSGMYAKMCRMSEAMKKMAEDKEVYLAENADLKKFKADVDAKQKEYAVDSTIKELTEKFSIPEDVASEMKTEADKFEFAQIDAWKNSVKAKAVDFAVKTNTEDDKHDFMKIGFPFTNGVGVKQTESPWPVK